MTDEGGIELPWKIRTRQEQGGQSEKEMARKRGARVHPRSGAGNIKADASDDVTVIEFKDANKSYILKSAELETLLLQAARQNKDAEFVIRFRANNIVATMKIGRY